MGLTCENENYEEHAWFYRQPTDFTVLSTKRGRNCCSCLRFITVRQPVLAFTCKRPSRSEFEFKFYGYKEEAVPMATRYMCEKCGDLALNLNELGYCTPPGEDMRQLVKEYAEMQKPVENKDGESCDYSFFPIDNTPIPF